VYSPSNIITVLSNIVVVVEILQTRSGYETGQTICVEKTHTSSSETLKPFYQLSVRRTRDRTGRRTQGITRQNRQGDRFGGKAGSGCLLKRSPSTTRCPRYRNPVATRRSGSPSRAHRPDSQSEGRRGEHRSTPVNCGRSVGQYAPRTLRHQITKITYNPNAFVKRSKPASVRTFGELSPDMITCLNPSPGRQSL
jgi:hypothetical protein